MIRKLIALRNAVFIAHRGKYEKLDVHAHATWCSWDSLNDSGWQEYRRAMELLSKHRWLELLLIKIEVI